VLKLNLWPTKEAGPVSVKDEFLKVSPAILQELASAAVLLELMIRPALFFKEWATMGPLSRTMAEGNGGTIAQVALMIHSLDGVLDYEGLQSVKESSKKKRVR
jgi:hypothetical protein